MWRYIIILIILSFLGATASIFFKRASRVAKIRELITNISFYIGGFMYVSAAMLNVYVLRHIEYSVAFPLTSITYVWTLILSGTILKESISKRKIVGIAFVLLGTIFISRRII